MAAKMGRTNDRTGANWPSMPQGLVTNITVETAQGFAFIDIGAAPDASTGQRFRIAPMTEYFATVVPGVDKVSAQSGSTQAVMTLPVGEGTSMVRLFYDDVTGEVEVMETAASGEVVAT